MESKSHPEWGMAMVMATDMAMGMVMVTGMVMAAGISPMIPPQKKCKSFFPVSGENNFLKLSFFIHLRM